MQNEKNTATVTPKYVYKMYENADKKAAASAKHAVYDNMAFGLKLRKIADVKTDKDGKQVTCMRMNTKQEIDEKFQHAAKIRATMRSEIIKFHDQLGATFNYVTHDQAEAMTIGTRIVVMKDGIVQQIGAPLYR